MAAKEQAIRDKLRNDATFAALVTGGTWLADDLGARGLSPDVATGLSCYDANGVLKLTAVLSFDTSNAAEARDTERQFFVLWLYHHNSYALIRQARRAAQNALHRVIVTTSGSGEGSPMVVWVNHLPEFTETGLHNALGSGSRYAVQFGYY